MYLGGSLVISMVWAVIARCCKNYGDAIFQTVYGLNQFPYVEHVRNVTVVFLVAMMRVASYASPHC